MLSYFKTCKNGEATISGYNKHVIETNASVGMLGVKSTIAAAGVQLLNAAISFGISFLITSAISGIVSLISKLTSMDSKIKESAQKAKEEIDATTSSLQSNKKTVNESIERFEELYRGVDKLTGKNLTLSTSDYKEFLDLSSQLADIFPELNRHYDENGNVILDFSKNVTSLSDAFNILIDKQTQSANIDIMGKMPKILKDNNNSINEVKDEIDELDQQYELVMSKVAQGRGNMGIYAAMDNYEEALEKFSVDSSAVSKEFDISSNPFTKDITTYDISEFTKQIDESYLQQKEVLEHKLSTYKSEMNTYISNWMSTDWDYISLDETPKLLMDQLIGNFDLSLLPEDVDTTDWNSVYTYIKSKYILGLKEISPEIQTKMGTMLSRPSDMSIDKYIELVEQVQAYFDKNSISINLDFLVNDEKDVKNRLQNRIQELSKDNKYTKKINNYLSDHSIDTTDEIEHFLKVTESANEAEDAIRSYENYLASLQGQSNSNVFSESNNEILDNYQEKISKISGYIENLNNKSLTSGDVLDISQELKLDPSKIDMTTESFEGLKEQLIELSELEFTKVINSLNQLLTNGDIDENVYKQLSYTISDIKTSASNSVSDITSLSSGLTNLQNSYKALDEAKKEYNETNKISYDKIKALSSAYPELENELMNYLSGVTDGSTLIESLSDAYDTDLKNYKNYYAEKHKYDEDFYKSIVENVPENVKARFKEYEHDLINYTNLINAKADLEANLEEAIYSDIMEDSTSIGGMGLLIDQALARKEAKEEKLNLLKELNDAVQLTVSIPEVTYTPSKSSSSKTKNKNEIDWAANSIANLTNEINALNQELDKDSSYTKKIELLDSLKEKQTQLLELEKQSSDEYKNRYNNYLKQLGTANATKYKSLIESDTALSLEIFGEDNKDLYEKVSKAQSAWKSYQQSLIDYESQVIQAAETQNQIYETLQASIENKISRTDNGKQDIQNQIDSEESTYGYANEELYQKIIDKNTSLLEYYNAELKNALANRKEIRKTFGKDSEAYNKADNEVQELQNHISDLNKEQTELNETISKLPTTIYEYQVTRIDNGKQDIQNRIDMQETKYGYASESLYQKMIDKNTSLLTKYKSELSEAYAYREKMLNQYGKDSKAYVDADNAVQDLQDSIYSLNQEQIELNRTLLKYPINKLEQAKEVLEDELELVQKQKEKVTDAISSASNIVQDQIDYYNELRETTSDMYDSQIETIQDQVDKLTEVNEAIEQQMALEKAQYNLEKALNQKSVKIYREGQGFIYEADQDAIRDAKEALDDEEFNAAIFDLNNQKDALNKEKDEALKSIDVQINSLELYKERIDSITEGYEKMLKLQQLISLFGQDSVNKIMNGDLSIVDDIKNSYNQISSQETYLQKQIEQYDKDIEHIEKLAETWNGSKETIQKAKEAIELTVTDNEKEIDSIKKRVEAVSTINDAWEETRLIIEEQLGFIQDNQIVAKDEEYSVLSERLENIKSFANQAAVYLKQVTNALSRAESAQSELNKIANNAKNTAKSITLKVDTMGKKHSGMETGFVGDTKGKDTFKYIALSKLKPDEIPTLLLKNEAVLSETQQNYVLDNMRNAFISGTKFAPIQSKSGSDNRKIEMNGDIVLQGVQDTDTFAKKIKNEFLIKLDQELYK